MKDIITSPYYNEILKISGILLAGYISNNGIQPSMKLVVDSAEELYQEIKKRESEKK